MFVQSMNLAEIKREALQEYEAISAKFIHVEHQVKKILRKMPAKAPYRKVIDYRSPNKNLWKVECRCKDHKSNMQLGVYCLTRLFCGVCVVVLSRYWEILRYGDRAEKLKVIIYKKHFFDRFRERENKDIDIHEVMNQFMTAEHFNSVEVDSKLHPDQIYQTFEFGIALGYKLEDVEVINTYLPEHQLNIKQEKIFSSNKNDLIKMRERLNKL